MASDTPFAIVIFGASGDLTRRKLVPALWALFQQRTLPEPFLIVGVARSEMAHDDFRRRMRDGIAEFARAQPATSSVWDRFAGSLYYCCGDPSDLTLFKRLSGLLGQLEAERKTGGNRLFYCATPPSLYPTIVTRIGEAGLHRESSGWTRIIIEKPFGRDVASATELNEIISPVFTEDQVYRIDHYLGKETVQNLLVFRFANGIFEPIWNRNQVNHVQITVAESLGIEGRGTYYEEAGALRDMTQNHLLQLLCLVAMEPPVSFDADPIRDEKSKVLRAIRPISPAEVDQTAVRGQYGPGHLEGQTVPGYRSERDVAPESKTETFAALRLNVDNWRWAGVPFYLRTGKRLPKRVSEIAIQFRGTPHLMFQRPEAAGRVEPDQLVFRIQPDEGSALTFQAKLPGPDIKTHPVTMDFRYGAAFGGEPPEAYERLLLDAIRGDATLYARADWVALAWKVLMPVLEEWEAGPAPKFPNYAAGTWGPAEADAFMEHDARRWRRP